MTQVLHEDENEYKGEGHESVVGTKLSMFTTRKVIILVLLMLLCQPL